MKRKTLLLLLLMALGVPLAMNGQTSQTISWGSTSDNSGTTSSTQNSPFGRYYGWEYKVFCYRPNTLPFSGDITKIEFLPATTQSTAGTNTNSSITINGSTDSNPMQIWMKEVAGDFALDASTAFSTYASGATKVYSGNIPATTAGTMTSFTLSSNFSHSQANSLLILVRTVANNGTGDGAVNAYYKELTGGVNLCWYQRQDSSDPGASTTADGVITNNLPVLQVTYTGGSSCSAPTITGVNNITGNSASVSWTGNNDSYILQYINLATATPTASSVTETILAQGFEGSSLPTGWTNEGAASWSVGKGDYSESTGAHNGSYNAKITHGTSGNETYLVTPAMDLTAYANAKVSCWYVNRSWAGDIDGFGVYYRIGTGAWQELFSTSDVHSSYTQTAQLSLPSAADVQVGFKYTDNYGYGVALDDILVTGNPYEYSWTTASSNATSPYTLSGLTSETDYLVRVIGVCNGTQSDPSDVVSFTTESACPAPTGLTVSDITPNSAIVSWDGEADSHNVRYRKVIGESQVFFDGFENGIGNWTTVANSYSNTATNWRQFNAENFIDDDGNPTMFNHTGGYVAMSRSYGGSSVGDQTVDNWLISPQVTLDGVLKYWVINDDGADYVEHYAIYVSTSGNSTGNFTLLYEPTSSSTAWTEHTVDLSSFNGATGYIAFRHNDTGKDFLLIDDVSINAVQYSAWTTGSDGSNSFNITGLDPESTYQVQVQGDCGSEDGTSAWSTGVIFETVSACMAPTGLSSTDVLATSATLNWVGYQDSYDVRYKPAYFEGFEDGIPSTWTTIDSDSDGYNWIALSDVPTVYPYYTDVSSWAHSGSNSAVSSSFYNNVGGGGTVLNSNQWLISPKLYLEGTLKFYAASTYADEFEVLLSTTGTAISDFTTTLRAMTAVSTNSGWDEVSINLNSYAGQHGYIAIHHVFSDGYFLIIDDFSISGDTWHTATASTNTLTISGLEPSTSYEWQVKGANCSDWSNYAYFTTDNVILYSITASANPTEGGTVAFMTGAANSTETNTHLPSDSYYNYCYSQQIYTPAEIGGGIINSIAFYNQGGADRTRTFDLYMVHTTKDAFASTSDWIPVTNSDKVFSGTVTYVDGAWTTITLDTPFNYNGTQNLALVIDDNTNSFDYSPYLTCKSFTPATGGNCGIYVRSDGTNYDPSSPSTADELQTVKNQILVNGSATRTFPEGATCTLVATPNTDYRFVDWTEDDEQISTSETYSFTVTGDRTLAANFEPNSHTVTIVPNNTSYGSVSQGTVVNVPHNATISTSGNTLTVNGTTVTATPAQATGQYTYTFSDWSNVPATVTEDVTITANFTQTVNNYTVNIEPNDANYGSVSPVSVTSVPYGTTITTSGNTLTVNDITVTATPAQATAQYTYAFSSWSNAPETVTGNVTITANFTQTTNSYNLTLVADPTAGGTVSGDGTYNYGEEVTITATANDGYTFGSWSDNGAQSHTVTITGDATYTATFTQDEYTLTLTAEPADGGLLSASPEQATYHYGDEVEVTATPNDGFNFGSWSDGGAQTHTVTITDNTELIAYFGADHTLTTYVNPIEGGYVTIAENQVSTIGAVTVGSGTEHNVYTPFDPNTAYSFAECIYLASEIQESGTITSISYNCANVSTTQSNHIEVYMMNLDKASFANRRDFVAVTASDKVFDGTWTVSSEGWNTIILDKPFQYNGTDNLLIGIHENTPGTSALSFRFTSVANSSVLCFDNSKDMDPTNLDDLKYSHGMPELHDQRANVRLGFGTYHNGQSITLTAHANEGYQFVNWTENDVEIGTNDTYTVSMTEDRDYTIYANFERLAKRFITAGDWNVATNWSPAGAPDITEDVYIEAAATIPSGCVATANEINITTGSITIADGGQLQHNNTGVSLTAQKEITGYTSENAQTNWNYYLFSSPVDNIAASDVTGLQTSEHYDLYKFVSNNVESGNLLEWVPVGDNGSLVRNEGYIYASRTDTRIEITGTVLPSNTTISNTLTYNDGYRFGGWNLIGNPFVCNAYVNVANYYILNHQSGYDEFVATDNTHAIAPMSGLMVVATAANQSITYSRTAPGKGAGILNIDVNRTMDRSTTLLDRARVRFGEGEGLQKFQFNPNHTKVYIPEGDKDFAVYYADGAGTIPVNFKAEDNGRYTLDFSTEEIGFNYLHLIDNMNGNNVDLLQTPYYAFDAKSTDFASRFTLVFATGSSTGSDTFAFFNNGVWIINNDGKAELQVVDALGRILSSETISGSCSKAINAAPGVYMLRLINGNDVKVQKVVVRR